MWSHRKFQRGEQDDKACISKSWFCYDDREQAVLELPRALELLTLLILNVPEKFHSRKTEMIKSLQSRVHGTPVPKGHSHTWVFPSMIIMRTIYLSRVPDGTDWEVGPCPKAVGIHGLTYTMGWRENWYNSWKAMWQSNQNSKCLYALTQWFHFQELSLQIHSCLCAKDRLFNAHCAGKGWGKTWMSPTEGWLNKPWCIQKWSNGQPLKITS